MAITINSKFVKFNYVKYRTVEGQEGPQPYVREDIAEILDAIVNYGSIAFIYGYDNTLPWPDGNATEYIPDDPQILGGNVIFAQGKWFGTSKASLEDALGDSKIIEKLQTELNIGHPAVGEPDQEGYEAPTGIFAEIDKQIKELKYFNRIGVPVEGTDGTYVMGAVKPGATLTIKGEGSTNVTANADTGTITISSVETTKNNIIIAGGPLANNVTETDDTWPKDWVDNSNGNKIIPAGKSLEEILKVLFLQEKYGTLSDTVYAWNPVLSNTPTVDIKQNTTSVVNKLVPVGTEVTVTFAIHEGVTNQATATVSGATYGYSLDSTTIKDGTSYTANATRQSVTGTLAIESATFKGVDITSQTAEAKYKVNAGNNILNVTQGGLIATPGTFADATVYNVSNTRTINKQDSRTINQGGFTSSTAYAESKALSNSISVKVTGYYPIYYGWLTYTSDTITSDYITANFVKTLKASLDKTPNANVPTTTTTGPGNSSFILALPVDLGYTSIVVKNATNEAPAGTPHYVDVDSVVETKQYRVFYIANSTPTTGDATFKIELKK